MRDQEKNSAFMTKIFFERVSVLGVGLIGASFSLAMKSRGLCGHVEGFGRNRENLLRAKERGIIDSVTTDPGAVGKNSDLVLLATPVGSFSYLARAFASSLKEGAVLTDAGSVKGDLVYELEKLIPPKVRYIGAHPIAGSDRSGFDAADAGLFQNARCVITPTENSDPDALETVTALWRALGSEIVKMDPGHHDRIYASVSHLPHLIAYAIVNTVADTDISYLDFCGQGFRDTTRIAASSHELWRDICIMNRHNLLDVISTFQKNLDSFSQYLRASDSDSLEREFKKARTLREGLGQN
jgi:prephenate dehydrogenase